VLFDGDSVSALRAYEDSVRQQEESRLRARKRERLRALAGHEGAFVLVEIGGGAGRTPAPVYFSAIELRAAGETVAALPLGGGAFHDAGGSHLEKDGSAWGEAVDWHGRPARALLNYGSPFQKVAGVFAVPRAALDSGALTLAVDAMTEAPAALTVRAFAGDREMEPAPVDVPARGWTQAEIALAPRTSAAAPATVNVSGVHGTGSVVVRNAAFVDERGRETFVLEHGRPATLEIAYRVMDPDLPRLAQIVVAWQRNGVQDVCRFFAREIRLDGVDGTVRLSIDRLPITDGQYAITIMITEAGYYDREQTVFFAVNPGVHCSLSRLFEVEVVNAGLIGAGTMAVAEGGWTVGA
jgi:hypothetical protein